jgi:hypothetical protein
MLRCYLARLGRNSERPCIDCSNRKLDSVCYERAWWRYVSDPDQNDSKARFADCIKCLVGKIQGLQTTISGLQTDIMKEAGAFPAIVAATQEPFFSQRDPTLLVGGIQPGWPSDYLDRLITRIDSQIVTDSTSVGIDSDISNFLTSILPTVKSSRTKHQPCSVPRRSFCRNSHCFNLKRRHSHLPKDNSTLFAMTPVTPVMRHHLGGTGGEASSPGHPSSSSGKANTPISHTSGGV